jgi:hypothetical protein
MHVGDAYDILVGELGRKKPLRVPLHRWKIVLK